MGMCPKGQCCSGGARSSRRNFCCPEGTKCCGGNDYTDPGACAKAGEQCCTGGVCPNDKQCCSAVLDPGLDNAPNLKCCDQDTTCCATLYGNICCAHGCDDPVDRESGYPKPKCKAAPAPPAPVARRE